MNFNERGPWINAAQPAAEASASTPGEWFRVFAVSIAIILLLVAVTVEL